MKLVDLSIPLEADVLSEPSFDEEWESPPRIRYVRHEESVETYLEMFGVKKDEVPDNAAWAVEVVHALTHAGTHLDAPWHYGSVIAGKPAKTIDEVPLEWCYGDAVVLDMRQKGVGEFITVSDVEQALGKINYEVKPKDIVLFQTDGDKLWGKPEYLTDFPGVSKEAAVSLIEKGVKVMGTDAYNFDLPFQKAKELYEKTGDPTVIESCHVWMREKEHLHFEKLSNLDKLPPYGFKFAGFPIKIKGASAGWVRAVAFVEE